MDIIGMGGSVCRSAACASLTSPAATSDDPPSSSDGSGWRDVSIPFPGAEVAVGRLAVPVHRSRS
jgi:hypothetical protein